MYSCHNSSYDVTSVDTAGIVRRAISGARASNALTLRDVVRYVRESEGIKSFGLVS